MTYTNEMLKLLMEEYLLTISEDMEEFFGSERGLIRCQIKDFLDWLAKRDARSAEPSGTS